MKADEKKCPRCAEVVKLDALVCRHCGYQFDPAEVKAAQDKKKSETKAGAIGCLVLGGILLAALGMCSGSSDTPEETKAKEVAAAEDRRKGMHCLSQWDGSNNSFVEQVKAGLRDPESFEHVETRITPVDKDGEHTIFMQYRAKNGFGGMNNPTATGIVRQSDCSARVVTLSLDGQ